MFWLCLRFPQLALEALRIDARTRGERPFAIVDGPLQRRHVVLADAAALEAGVRSGHTVAAAQMLCPRLVVAPRDPPAERQALESLASWAYRFSAEVSIGTPDTVFLEVGRSLALFGGWPALERRLRAELDAFGFTCLLAAAPTATAASVLTAQATGIAIPEGTDPTSALGKVSLAASGLDASKIAALDSMGFRHLRDLFRLPRAELARRIGEDALDHLDRMRGLVTEALPHWHPASCFERRIEFPSSIESHTALAFPLQRLIRELATFLVARDGGVQRFALVFDHERGASTTVKVGLLAPQRDATSLFELARTRLERIQFAAPVLALGLLADDLPPLCPLHRDLFDTDRREQLDWPTLAERLHARLGDTALRGLARAADHRPSRAWRFVAATGHVAAHGKDVGDASVAAARRKSIAAETAPATRSSLRPGATIDTRAEHGGKTRPFWLLHRPVVLRGTPRRIIAGPERIESGWWDEGDERRDYYVVETRRGQHAWAFLAANSPVASDSAANWMLHGWFA